MYTALEQAALLSKFQCCYAELAGKVASKLGKYKLCNLKSELREMKLVRAYLYRIHKYYTLENEVAFAYLITFERPDNSRVTIRITVNGVDYTMTNTRSDLDTIITYFTDALVKDGYAIELYGDNGFIVYSLNPLHEDYEVTGTVTANPTPKVPTTIEVTEYKDAFTDILLDGKNCLSREEICGIINHTCCILDKYCTT